MLKLIELYVFVLSIVFIIKYGLEFMMALKEDDPSPLVISNTSKVLLYLSISYIITGIIGIISGLI